MNLFVSSFCKKTLVLVVSALLMFSYSMAQDKITAFGQEGTARLDVDTPYPFDLTSSVAPGVVTWTVWKDGVAVPGGDYSIIGGAVANVSITFNAILVAPTLPNHTYVVRAEYGGGLVASITVTLLPYGGLMREKLEISFRKYNKVSGTYEDTNSLDITKGEMPTEGELIQVSFAYPDLEKGKPPLSLSGVKKIGIRVANMNGSPLFPSANVPPLLQITASKTTVGNLRNDSLPGLDLSINEKGKKDFVLYPYIELPYVYRMDTIDYQNDDTETQDDFANLGREILDPRINYDDMRSKLWLSDTFTELNFYNAGLAPVTVAPMVTDPTALIDMSTDPTVYNFRPNPTPSGAALTGTPTDHLNGNLKLHGYANTFEISLGGNAGSFDLPIKALEHGGAGSVKLFIDIYNDTTATTPALSVSLVVRVVEKIPNMALSFQLDGETTSNGDTIIGVAGKDINLRIFVDRIRNGDDPIPAIEGPSGAQEYLLIDTQAEFKDLWAFRNFDETIFDPLEFDPTLDPDTNVTDSILFQGVASRPPWKHHGYHINIQNFNGVRSNCLFNDIPYLIQHDNDVYAGSAADGTVIYNTGRYTVTKTTKIGLLNTQASSRFMYSQARLYTRNYALRENLPTGTVHYTANLFANVRAGISQRAITLVPRTVGTYSIKVDIKTPGGATIDSRVVTLNIVPEIIEERVLDPAEADDVAVKPVRAGDFITYPDKSFTSTYSDFGITEFDMRLEGIGAATDILYDVVTGSFGAQSHNEVDLDDLEFFSFSVKDDYHFYYQSANSNGAIGINNLADLDGDTISNENFYETTGRPEPMHLRNNGIDDDGDGVVDDNQSMPTGRAESSTVRVGWAQRSMYYQGGTLRNYYAFADLQLQVESFATGLAGLISAPTVLTPAVFDALQAAHPLVASAGITAAINAAKADPFLSNVRPSAPRRRKLLSDINAAVLRFQYESINYGSMVNEITLPNPIPSTRPRDDFAPVPTAAGMPPLELNKYYGEVVYRNLHTVGASLALKPIKLATAIRTCTPLKEVYFKFTQRTPWVNRNGSSGVVPISFQTKGSALTTAFSFMPSLSVTDKKYVQIPNVGNLAAKYDGSQWRPYPNFINPQGSYQNFSTAFRFTGGVSNSEGSFVNRMTNNYRPFLNMFEPRLQPPTPAAEYANLAGLNGWVYHYSGITLNLIHDNTPAEAKNWVVEQRVGPIVPYPDSFYSPKNPLAFTLAKNNQIIMPEEDSRWRPDDTTLQGFESWFRNVPIKEVLAMESNYIALYGIDQGYDPEHVAGGKEAGAIGIYLITHASPSPAYHEVAGNNSALRLYIPSTMLDTVNPMYAAFTMFTDEDDSGTFNLAVDRLIGGGSGMIYDGLTRTYSTMILSNDYYDDKYDEMYDIFIVARLDSGYPDIGTGAPPFSTGAPPDSSAIRFGMKIELFKPSSTPKASPDYLTFIDQDGKEETVQDTFFIVNTRADSNDIDMKSVIFADSDHPLESGGFVVRQGGSVVRAMKDRDQKGAPVGSSISKDLRSPADLLAANFPEAPQRFGTATTPFVPFARTALSDAILNGDSVNPPFFPLSMQGVASLPDGILQHHIHLPILPANERTANFDKVIERQKAWRNDVYAQVRPYESDKNGNGVCDPEEDLNSDGMFTQDVVMLMLIPEKYPAGHPRAGQSFYDPNNDFKNMADIRWSIVRNESGSHLSSGVGYVIPGDVTGTNYVTYYPGSLNGLDWVKGENIKTGRSLIAAILVRNNPATDGIDNDNDARANQFVTTIGSLVGLTGSDPRAGIRCINPSAVFNADLKALYENFPNIDFADDDYLDAAGSLDPGYIITPFTDIGTGTSNKGNAMFELQGMYQGEADISVLVTSTYNGTGTVGVDPITFSVAYTNSITLATTTQTMGLDGTSSTLNIYRGSDGSVDMLFDVGGTIALGDTFHFTMVGIKDWDGDGYSRYQEQVVVPGAQFPETNAGYHSGLEIDLSWNNPRPFYAIKVRADKPATDPYNGEYGKDYVFTTKLHTREVVGSGVWTSTVEMQLDDMRYLGAGGILSAAPISLPLSDFAPSDPGYLYFMATPLVSNVNLRTYAAGNLFVVTENQYAIAPWWNSNIDITAQPGTDLIRITQNPYGTMAGEWIDNTGEIGLYPLAEYCLFPHMTLDMQGRAIYDFDLATLPGDHSRYAAGVFETKHTIADYTTPSYGLVRIDPNSMPTPVLQLNAADTSDPITLTFTDGERVQKIRVNFLNVRGFKPSEINDDPNSNPMDSMLQPLSNDMLGGLSVWKDNKDPGSMSTVITGGTNLITSGRSALVGSVGQFDALVDVIVDVDGWDSPRAYTNWRRQYSQPLNEQPLTKFKPDDKIFFVDRDNSKSYTLGDDIYFDQGQPGLDSGDKIIYTQKGLGTGLSYNLGDPAHNERLKYYDINNNGKYDNGEDIVYEYNNLNGIWELPIDEYVPLDKDALRWRWDKENNLWYIVLDLENDEEIPPEDIFGDLEEYVKAPTVVDLRPLRFPGDLNPNFYTGSDYHICIRAAANMDYLTAFMVEIPDYWKHTQALTDYDDIAGVWLASQPQTVTYPSMPGSSITSPVIVANMPVVISDETVDRPTRNRIGRNSPPFAALGINLIDNSFNNLKIGNDLLKTVFGSNRDIIGGSGFGSRLSLINGNRKTVLEDLVVELFNSSGGVGSTTATGTIVPGKFNPVSDLLALDRTTKGDDIFRSLDGSGIYKTGDPKILRLGSRLENGRIVQDDLTVGKQGKRDPNIVFIDINGNNVYDDNLDILVYDVDGLTSNGLPTGTRTFKFGDAILKRGFVNWDPSLGDANDVSKLQPNDVSTIVGRPLLYDSSLWYEDDDESGGFSNEASASGVALYRDRSDGSPYDNGKFDMAISSKGEIIVLDEVVYLQEAEYVGQAGQPQHQVRMRPAVFDISSTMLPKVNANGLADPSATSVDKFVVDFARTATATHGGTGEDYREQTKDDLFNPFIDLDGNGVDDSNKLYAYNKDTSLPDHHPLRVNLFQDKNSPSYGDENGMGPYGEWGYLRAPLDDGQSSPVFDPMRAITRNTGNKHAGPDFFVVLRTSNVATNGDDFRIGISSWGRDTAHVMLSAPQPELGNRGIGFDDRVEDFELIGQGGGTNTAAPFLYPGPPSPDYVGTPFGDVSNSRTYTKFLSATILVDGQAPDDVKTFLATVDDTPGAVKDQIKLDWVWEKDPDPDRAGVLLIRRKGVAPNLKLLEDGQFYIGPEITKEVGEANRKYLTGYLGFATKTVLTASVNGGSPLASALSAAEVTISHADFANLPEPPSGGKCYLLIGATASGDKAEIVSYTAVGSALTIKRGELGTASVAHSAGASVTFLPPRPVAISELINEAIPLAGSPVVIKVAKSEGLAGFPKEGVVRIGSEVIRYDGVTFSSGFDSLNIVTRGIDSTVVAPHSAGNKVNWSYHPTYTIDTISVQNTASFPVSGRLKINNEEVWYNAKTANSFKGIVRGIKTDDANRADTPVSAHNAGSEVIDSLYKVIMNDKDLDGAGDFNNDGNDDGIALEWTDDLFYGDDPSAYYYYLFTYDDVLNYSAGKFASVNNMNIKRYTPPSGSLPTGNAQFATISLGSEIHVNGGDVLYFMVDGGSPRFTWTATAAGLSTNAPPAGYDAKGETERYITYNVPDIPDVEHNNITITVMDSSASQQMLSIVLYVDKVTERVDMDKFRVTSDRGVPRLNTNTDATVTIQPGEVITFTAFVPSDGNINLITWVPDVTGSNFFGTGVIVTPDVLTYTAISAVNPALTSGTDTFTVSDGTTSIKITIIISPIKADEQCDTTKPLSVVPGSSGSVTVSPGSSFVLVASGGSCNFTWSLTANNSITATLERVNNVRANYTAGSENRQVDIIELSDGVTTKTVKVHVTAASTKGRSGGGCFIRDKAHQRD